MIQIDKSQIDAALPRIIIGLERYLYLQNRFQAVNILTDLNWQKKFNGFYKVRRNLEWRKIFYSFFEMHKNSGISFEATLTELFNKTQSIEASFSSKLVATINPQKPIIDRFVLDNVGLKLPYQASKNRIPKIINIYLELERIYETFLISSNGRYLVEAFKKKYPNTQITELKMVDLVLWQTR